MSLTNSQYDAIMRIYQQKQLNNRAKLVKRREEIYQKLPAYAMMEEEIVSLSMEEAKKQLLEDEFSLAQTKAAIHSLIASKQDLLTSNGYSKDYLEDIYDCKDCNDTGYIEGKKCHCFRQAEINLLYTQSNVKNILESENFNTFRFDFYNESYIDPTTGHNSLVLAQNAFDICLHFTQNFDSEFENLLIYGSVGVGKTFLTHCVAKSLLESGHSVIYFTAHQLFDTLAEQKFDTQSADTIPETSTHILDCDLLIIDDLGTELTNSFVSSQLFLCINERFLRKKSTMISTNLSLSKINETYSERTFSRLSGNYKLIKLTGEDIRRKKRRLKT
ncbi:MAG: ATP-binding protein [Lachnospiraceae bacterium]|nr:ATP-binding protein [Lachnospiraceae bacterium]